MTIFGLVSNDELPNGRELLNSKHRWTDGAEANEAIGNTQGYCIGNETS